MAEKFLIIGDSLSKEYEVEFPVLFPTNLEAADERNWIELLSTKRSSVVNIGRMGVWPDSRITGHEYNFAFPGSQTSEWVDIIQASLFSQPQKVLLRLTFESYLEDDADRVVIFLGGNDLKNNYGTYYDGADPAPFISRLVNNTRVIVDYVRGHNAAVPIVLVNMPDVGVTPTVIQSKPDAAKRQRVTNLTRAVNDQLRALADQRGIGYADIFSLTTDFVGTRAWVIGGVDFIRGVDPQSLRNRPRYLFSPDGFHPNTNSQLLFANRIAEAFRRRYPNLAPIPPFTSEEMLRILGIEPDVTFAAWSSAYGLSGADPTRDGDGDGVEDYLEYALGLDPRTPDAHLLPDEGWSAGRLALSYQPRVKNSQFFQLLPQISEILRDWAPLPSPTPDSLGVFRVEVQTNGPRGFLRLQALAKP